MSSPVFLPFSWRSLWGLRVGRLVRRYGVLKVITCMVTRSHSPRNPPPLDINHSSKLTRRHSQRCRSSAVEVPGGVGGGGVTDEQLDSVSVSGWEWTNGAWFLHFLLTLTRWLTANQNKWQLKHQLSWACDRVWCNVVDSINNCFKVAGVVCSEMLLCRSWL